MLDQALREGPTPPHAPVPTPRRFEARPQVKTASEQAFASEMQETMRVLEDEGRRNGKFFTKVGAGNRTALIFDEPERREAETDYYVLSEAGFGRVRVFGHDKEFYPALRQVTDNPATTSHRDGLVEFNNVSGQSGVVRNLVIADRQFGLADADPAKGQAQVKASLDARTGNLDYGPKNQAQVNAARAIRSLLNPTP